MLGAAIFKVIHANGVQIPEWMLWRSSTSLIFGFLFLKGHKPIEEIKTQEKWVALRIISGQASFFAALYALTEIPVFMF